MYPQLQDLKSYLSINSTDDDFLLSLNLTQAVKVIENHTQRQFTCTQDTTKTFYSDDRFIVNNKKFLFNDDICSLTSLVINGNTIPSNKYRITGDIPFTAIVLFPSSSYFFENYSTTIDPSSFSITGRWAYSIECPRDLFGVILRLSAWLYHQKDNASDFDRPVSLSNTMALPVGIPTDVAEACYSYSRYV